VKRQAILYFASVYWDDPRITPQQIALQLGRRFDVLYVEPSPCAPYLRDLGRNRRWLRTGRPPVRVADGLTVYSPPPMLPLKTRVPLFNLVSQRWVRPFVRRAAASIGMEQPVLFTYLPHLHATAGTYGERAVCYYCIDDMGSLTRVINPAVVEGFERALLAKTDLVFTTSRGLQARLSARHPDVRLVPNGSDPELYAAALSPETPVAPELSGLGSPVLGYSGVVDYRVDQELIAEVARRRPGWSFVFVGPVRTPVSRLAALPNVRFMASQPQSALPSFFKGFTVALIPYTIGPMVRFIYPTKLNDYLGAGLPVVATMLPELEGCPEDIVSRVSGPDEFTAAVERLVASRDDRDAISARVAYARENSWERRAAVIAGAIEARLGEGPTCAS
jgi:hypothetical protein